jgi:hypothetical protein
MGLEDQLRAAVNGDQLPCSLAHKLAREWGVMPETLGAAAKGAGIRISRCQMGLFGFGPKGTPGYRVVQPAEDIPAALSRDVQAFLVDGRLPCRVAWELGRRRGLPYRQIGNVLEGLKIRVKPCQLGQF